MNPGLARALGVAAISCWEVATLVEKGCVRLDRSPLDWIEAALALPQIELFPLTPAVAVRAIKDAVDRGLETDLGKGIDIETEGFLAAFASEDFHEGLTAFLKHRKPTFGHR